MKVYLLKKEKGKKYDSKTICEKVLAFSLQYDKEKPLGCSISDTKNFWACAIGECGIDMEEKGRIVKSTVTRALHPRETSYLAGLSFGSSEWNEEFFRIWTAKEAIYKLTGKNFKQAAVLDDELNYLDNIDGYGISYYADKRLLICLVSKDACIEIENIKFAGVSAVECIDYAAGLLADKPYSSMDMQKKLKTKGYNDSEIAACISKLIELGYLNDADYAMRFAENALQSGKGSLYIKNKLMQSGISADDIPELGKDIQFENAMALAKEIYKECDDFAEKQKMLAKIGRRLASRGFDSNTVYKVLDKFR